MLSGQSAHKLKRQGDDAYRKGDFQTSEESYRKAQLEKKSLNGAFNLGNSIYQQERYDEAARQYEDMANNANASDEDRSDAFHNLGNTFFNMQQFDKSVDAYKESLKLDPKNMETKFNLSQALRQLKLQQQEQQQNQEQQEQEQQEEQEQQQQDQQQDQQQPQQQEQQQPDEQEQQQQDLTKEEARQLLEIMEQEEKKVQEKLKKAQKGPNKSKKDW